MSFDTVFHINIQAVHDQSELREILSTLISVRRKERPHYYFIACRDAIITVLLFIQLMWLISSGFVVAAQGLGPLGWTFGIFNALVVLALITGHSPLHEFVERLHRERTEVGEEWRRLNSQIKSTHERLHELTRRETRGSRRASGA